MASAIDATKPTDAAVYAGDLRQNLATAKSEISELQTLVASAAEGITWVSDDPSPDLGGDLNVNGHKITTLQSNGNVVLEANGTGLVRLNSAVVEMARQLRHVGNVSTWIIFETDDVAIGTADASRISVNNLGVRFGTGGSRVTTILDQDAMTSNSDTALATQQSIKAYVDANKGIASVSADPGPTLGGPLNGGGHIINNYTQPKVQSVNGELTQASHGGRPCHITGTTTVPLTDGFVCELRNRSGSAKTINAVGGGTVLIHEGAEKSSISLPHLRSVVVAGDGDRVWVYGALA